MSRSIIYATLFLIASSCADNDSRPVLTGSSVAMQRAKALCNTSDQQMLWLDKLIGDMDSDVYLKGSIYGIKTGGGVVFVHQPYVMSCLACVCYDCAGQRIASSHLSEEIIAGMKSANLIYQPFE